MLKIFVLDDMTYLHDRYKLILKGYDVKTFDHIESFLKQVFIERPHFLILDHVIKDRTSLEVVDYLISRKFPLDNVIIISGNLKMDVLWNYKKKGVRRFLVKPFNDKDLLNILNDFDKNSNGIKTSYKKILAVDDNMQILLLYRMLFKDLYDVDICTNKNDLSIKVGNYDLIILDFNFVGEDFLSILDLVNKKFPSSKKIMVTGDLKVDKIRYFLQKEFEMIVYKPIDLNNFKNIVVKILG